MIVCWCPCMYVRMYVCVYICVCWSKCTSVEDTRPHAITSVLPTQSRVCECWQVHMCMCTYEGGCVHANRTHMWASFECMHLYMSTYIGAYMHTHIHTYMHAYMHACIHACIGRCTYTYTHDASLSLRVPAQGSLLQSADDAA